MADSMNTEQNAEGLHWNYFRLRSYPTLATTPVHGVRLAAALLQVHERNFGPTDPPQPESSFRVSVAMQPMQMEALWLEDRWVPNLEHDRLSVCVIDMERRPTVKFLSPFALVQFYVPQQGLRYFARENGVRPV